jgi:hypothetical protein
MNAGLPQRPEPPEGGSLWAGFGLGWLVIVGGYGLLWMIAVSGVINRVPSILYSIFPLSWPLPWLAFAGLVVMFSVRNKPRSIKGMFLALASMVGLALLLVAACFGFFSLSGFH